MATTVSALRLSPGTSFAKRTLSRPSSAVRARKPSVVTSARLQQDEKLQPDPTQVPTDVIEYVKQMPGVTDPFPNIFDPANLLGDVGSSNTKFREVRRWRESEITHGRVAMLAAVGWIVQEALVNWKGTPFPHVQGPAIGHFQQIEQKGFIFWTPLVFAIGVAEAYRVAIGWNNPTSDDFYTLRDDYEPGNLGFDPLGLLPKDPKERKDMQSKELNNGRLAMIAIVAFVVQELLEKRFVFDQLMARLSSA